MRTNAWPFVVCPAKLSVSRNLNHPDRGEDNPIARALLANDEI
ncbi:hypothetical protein [Shewanella sp. D64]|nr:hypothetical protein [Shewanella sp. D64]